MLAILTEYSLTVPSQTRWDVVLLLQHIIMAQGAGPRLRGHLYGTREFPSLVVIPGTLYFMRILCI